VRDRNNTNSHEYMKNLDTAQKISGHDTGGGWEYEVTIFLAKVYTGSSFGQVLSTV